MRVTLAEGLLILFLLWLALWPAQQPQEAGDPEDAIKALSA
jgi:hypothetical protein